MDSLARLFEAIAADDTNSLRELLAHDPTLAGARDDVGTSALMSALYHRNLDAVELLRSATGDLDLFEAAALGEEQRVVQLLEKTPTDVSAFSRDGFTALHLASFFGRPRVVAILLQKAADADSVARNVTAVRPLHSAAAARNPEIVCLLLEAGADADAKQRGGWTALHAAARHGDVDIARALLAGGADPSLRADDGSDAESLARAAEQPEILSLLQAS